MAPRFASSCPCCSVPRRRPPLMFDASLTARRRLSAVLDHVAGGREERVAAPRLLPRSTAFEASDGGILINTVLGPISSNQLGMVLPHEHCYVSSAGIPQGLPECAPMDHIIPEAVAALRQFRAAGGSTIVDCTTHDLGRNVHVMAQIARESEVNIIATTGCWLDPPRVYSFLRVEDMADIWIKEATVGIQGTDIKAGILKCAHETGVTWERGQGFTKVGSVLCRSIARAQKATGLPITTHTEAEEQVGLAQIEIFEEEGVDLNRVYIGHCNDSEDLNYLTSMLQKGVWLGLDRTTPSDFFTDPQKPNWEGRAKTIKRLIDVGWGHRILLSHDWMVFNGHLPVKLAKRQRALNPDGYTFILQKVVPLLHEMGVRKDQTDAILYDNPKRFFENAR